MFGLEGSGFVLSVGLTLLIAGTIIFYVNNKFKETAQQIQTVLQIVQQVNSSKNMSGPPPPHVSNSAPQNINGYIVKSDDLISVSDDSDISSTTSDDEPSSKVVITVDEGEIHDNKNIIVNLSHAGSHVGDDVADDDVGDDNESSDESSDENSDEKEEIKNIDLDNTSGTELDSMLLNIIDLHKNSPPKLQDMKVTDLRDMIKDRGLKPTNLGKLKKQECIELLS